MWTRAACIHSFLEFFFLLVEREFCTKYLCVCCCKYIFMFWKIKLVQCFIYFFSLNILTRFRTRLCLLALNWNSFFGIIANLRNRNQNIFSWQFWNLDTLTIYAKQVLKNSCLYLKILFVEEKKGGKTKKEWVLARMVNYLWCPALRSTPVS